MQGEHLVKVLSQPPEFVNEALTSTQYMQYLHLLYPLI